MCWAAKLRGPLRVAARESVQAASRAALATGGAGAAEVARVLTEELLPLVEGDGEPASSPGNGHGELILGLFAELACQALGLQADQAPPPPSPAELAAREAEEDTVLGCGIGALGLSAMALCNGNEKAGRDACAEWLFGPRQDAWLKSETAEGKMSPPAAAAVSAAWRALDAVLSPATVVVASRASRGTEYSSVWARPDKLVWAKQAKNFYWPAMLLWGSGTSAALKEVNVRRVPPAFREELEKQVS